MTKKPTYEELERKIKELENVAEKLKPTEEALKESDAKWRSTTESPKHFISIGRDITENKEKSEQEQLFAFLFESNPDYISISDLNGVITFINRVGEGLTFEQVIGMNIQDFQSTEENKRLARETLEHVITTGEPAEFTHEAVVDDLGTTRMFISKLSPLRNSKEEIAGCLFRSSDITERVHAEEALQVSDKKYRTLFEDSRDAIYINTREGQFIDVNQSMLDLYGYTREEMMGTNIIELYANPDDRSRVLKDLDKKGSFRDYEIMFKKQDGTKMECLVTATVRRGHDGNILGYQGIMRDISEKKRLQTQLQHAQKMEALGTLAAGIAHDFNNLLMGIQGNASLMLLDIDSSHEHYEKLKAIEKMVQSGSSLTRQLLGYARKGRYEVEPLGLNQLVKESSDTFGRTRKEITIHRELEDNLFGIEADRVQMEQVLLNLYANAADSMSGGGDLILKTMNITHEDMGGKLYKPRSGKYVQLNVIDKGAGMDKETCEHIFDPFFTTKEIGRGTGLGLASVYGIIKAHGGYIDVESEKTSGTTFSVYLPASEKEVAKEKEFPEDVLKGTETVLLVDDEEVIISVGEQMLKTLGYQVIISRSGKNAIEIYKKNLGKIDMVILDVIMPGIGGGEAYDRMKEINPNIKVLLASGYSIEGQVKEILNRGCNGFIQKPFDIRSLSHEIRQVLDNEKS